MSLQDTGPETDLDDASFEAILSYDWDNDYEFQVSDIKLPQCRSGWHLNEQSIL